METEYLRRILRARVYEVAETTPLIAAPNLSSRVGREVLLKREDLQPVFSFKIRGAYNKIAHLSDEERGRGVIAASAGNHGQGVALGAGRFGVPALIVMPETTPRIKINAIRKLGAEIVLSGDSYSEAAKAAREIAAKRKMTFVHPFDDPDVIAGQGTIGLEILRQAAGPIGAIFAPVGGGGLVSGIAACIKAIEPGIAIVGVESEESDAMSRSLAAGEIVELERVGSFADGVAVRRVGDETFRIARKLVDEMICVNTDEICAAIQDVFEDTRSIMEPAGALAVAGLKKFIETKAAGQGSLIAICSGANMNFGRLRFVAERAETGEDREALLAVTIPERPGAFRKFMGHLQGRNITEFNYRFDTAEEAHIFVGITIGNRIEVDEIVRELAKAGMTAVDLMDNELAKTHIRYMVGGRNPAVRDERIVGFEFPERPGALSRFLQSLSPQWNISLFHYRNHGTDVGRVLAGIQVPEPELPDFRTFLDRLGYPWRDETGNPARRLFL